MHTTIRSLKHPATKPIRHRKPRPAHNLCRYFFEASLPITTFGQVRF